MRLIKEFKTTTNRSVYNKCYKKYLDGSLGEIKCSCCPYHDGENEDKKWYHLSLSEEDKYEHARYASNYNYDKERRPNWKLACKNRKQWMNKDLKLKRFTYSYEIIF